MVSLQNLIMRAKWIYAKNISKFPPIFHVSEIEDTNERFGFFSPTFQYNFYDFINFNHIKFLSFWKQTLSNINVIMTFPYRPVSFVPPLSIKLSVVYVSVIFDILAHNNDVRLDSWACWRRLNCCSFVHNVPSASFKIM